MMFLKLRTVTTSRLCRCRRSVVISSGWFYFLQHFQDLRTYLLVSGQSETSFKFQDEWEANYWCDNFYAPQLYRQVLLRRVLAMAILSVCLSVRPSVTRRCRTKPRWDREFGSSPHDSLGSLVSYEVIWCQRGRRFPSNEGIKEGYPP